MKKLFVIFVACLCMVPLMVSAEVFYLNNTNLEYIKDTFNEDELEQLHKDGVVFEEASDTNPNYSSVINVPSSVSSDIFERLSKAVSIDVKRKGRTKKEGFNDNSKDNSNVFTAAVNDILGGAHANDQQKAERQTEDNPKDEGDPLYKAMLSRSVDAKKLCVADFGGTKSDPEECAYISSDFGICDTHVYNKKLFSNSTNSDDIENVREMVATKITVISQQMYKQYEYLSSTLRRLRTQLQKAVLMADLEMAGGNSEKSSSGSYSRNNDKEIILAGAQNCNNISRPAEVYRCLQENINLVRSNVQTNRNQAKKQLDKIVDSARNWGLCLESEANGVCKEKCASYSSESEIKDCATSLSIQISRKQSEEEKDIMKYTGRQVY